MSRMDDLMHGAAECFRDGTSPFNSDWLSERGVSLDECQEMQEEIANAIDAHVVSTAAVRALSNRLATRFPQPQRVKGLIREQRRESQ